MKIAESDWKLFTTLKNRALDRYCRATLIDAAEICTQPLPSESEGRVVAPDRYRELYWLVSERNRRIAETFDGHSRSRALLQLMQIIRLNLLTTDELAAFSDETQDVIEHARQLAAGRESE